MSLCICTVILKKLTPNQTVNKMHLHCSRMSFILVRDTIRIKLIACSMFPIPVYYLTEQSFLHSTGMQRDLANQRHHGVYSTNQELYQNQS